ncbi:MAG TPA: Rsd/AlgQ family anti-sigma factor [Candidatus Competibacteraceae bacterium]|nr:Rsd/AlgQ family anti-sigma factor [Candidatus Competibacteraceae bacterium]
MNAILGPARLHSKELPDLIDKLLAVRQESLVLFQKLAALKPFAATALSRPALRRFRQALVDYLALGPFEVYEALEAQSVDSPYCSARELARRLYARISETTQTALDFHDRYDGALSGSALAELDRELSRLGEQLAVRIALEDRIVTVIRNGRFQAAARSIAAQPLRPQLHFAGQG